MVNNNYMRLSQWAALHGMHRMTAWRHYNAGTLPTELQPKKIGNIIYVLAHPDDSTRPHRRIRPGEQRRGETSPGESGQPAVGLCRPEPHTAGPGSIRGRRRAERPQAQAAPAAGRPHSPHSHNRAPGTLGPVRSRHGGRPCSQAQRARSLVVIDDAEVARRTWCGT